MRGQFRILCGNLDLHDEDPEESKDNKTEGRSRRDPQDLHRINKKEIMLKL